MDARRLFIAIGLAARIAAFEWRICVSFVIALAAVLGPLLVLAGLKFGIIDTMTARLMEDPRNREIVLVGSARLDEAWFAAKAKRPDVAFVLPRTRQIAAGMELRVPGTLTAISVEMLPSAAGDPLIAGGSPPSGHDGIQLSAAAARRLGVQAGDRLEGTVSRIVGGARERATVPVVVTGIADAAATAREVAFVSLDLLLAAEDYRDGLAVATVKWLGGAPSDELRRPDRIYAGFRLYARGIDDVAVLEEALAAEGLEVRTKSDEIATVRTLDRNLSIVFRIVAAIGAGGYLLSLGANLWLSVDMRRRELGILRLVGIPTPGLVLFPMVLGTVIAVAGTALAALFFLLAGGTLNHMFAASASGSDVCRLLPRHFVFAGALTLAMALVVAGMSGWRAARIQPEEILRDA